MNLKNKLLKHCSIKNVLIVLCILILLYLIYETYVVRENFITSQFDELSQAFKSLDNITGLGSDKDYAKLDMAEICEEAQRLSEICNQCDAVNPTEICFPPDISENCAYNDLYDYTSDYDVNKVGVYFGNTSYSSITNTDSESNNIYECKLKYAPVDAAKLNCEGALKNATLTGCDVLKLFFKVSSDQNMIPSPSPDEGPLNFFPDSEKLSEAHETVTSGGEKYFSMTEIDDVYRIKIDISNTNITTINKIEIGNTDTKIFDITDIKMGTLNKDLAETEDTLTKSLNNWQEVDNDKKLFLYEIKEHEIALKLYTLQLSSTIYGFIEEKLNIDLQGGGGVEGFDGGAAGGGAAGGGQTGYQSIKITFDTGDSIYLFKDTS